MSLPAPAEIAAALIAREEMPPERGEQGPTGKAGEFGPPGPQGAKGDQGANGTNGSNGDIGPVGPIGPGGPRGLKGDKGDKGEQGERGIQGPRGETGAAGSGRSLFPRAGGSSGGGAPSGAAGGDLSGTYPNPSVVNDSHSHTGATVSASDLAAVLAEGNDTGENTIEMPLGTIDGTVAYGTVSLKANDDGNDFGAELNLNPATTDTPGDIYLYGGGGDVGNPGGGVTIQGGSGNNGPGTPASIIAPGGTGAGNPGKLVITTDGSAGAAGAFLGSDGAGNTTWQTPNFQPTDSDLTAIAALSTTAYGRAILTLANEAALKALLINSFIEPS